MWLVTPRATSTSPTPKIERQHKLHSREFPALCAGNSVECEAFPWSWRESNPRPSGGHPTRYDHSRSPDSRQSARRVEWARGPAAGSFSDVSGLCLLSVVFPYRPPPLLVTGCDGQAPRGITARDDSLLTDLNQAARVRSSVLASLCLPRFRSLSNSGRTPKHPGPNVETDQPRCAVACQGSALADPKNRQE